MRCPSPPGASARFFSKEEKKALLAILFYLLIIQGFKNMRCLSPPESSRGAKFMARQMQ
jgi:hypothetical protein